MMKSYMKMGDKLLVFILCVILGCNLVLGRPGLAPNTIPLQRLVAVGLPARLPGGVQTPARRAQALLGQAPKQEGWPIITGLWLATAWVLGRAGHNHLSKHALSMAPEASAADAILIIYMVFDRLVFLPNRYCWPLQYQVNALPRI
jgi:hypothetical protein